jgi:pimeloyl-ACP methyl ester carboxylesterase
VKNDITSDPSSVDSIFPPEMHSVFIEGRILGLVYVADGKGPHETVVLLHGFPGNEKNLDVAHMLRRGGVNVVIFHYSGSWGSRGTYSFGQAYRDLQAVRLAIEDAAFAQEHRIDRNKVFLAGHSVGGFLTLLAARDGMDFQGFAALAPYNLSLQACRIAAGEENSYAETFGLFSGGLNPLSGATAEELIAEIIENRQKWDLLGDKSPYSGKKMLLVIASYDTVAPPSTHQIPVAEMMERAQGPKTVVPLACSHDFSEKRVALAKTLYDWIKS